MVLFILMLLNTARIHARPNDNSEIYLTPWTMVDIEFVKMNGLRNDFILFDFMSDDVPFSLRKRLHNPRNIKKFWNG